MDWNIKTLKEYFERILEEKDKALMAALSSTKEAIIKADTATEKRFESVNEFRNQLKDQQINFLTKDEYNRAHIDLIHQVSELKERTDKKDGEKTGGTDVRAWVIAGISSIVAIISLAYNILR